MADKKITELNSVNLPLTGIEEIPIVQNGETKKVEVSNIGGGDSLWEVSTGANSLIPKDSNNIASGDNAIAEGFGTEAKANYSRTGGRSTTVETSAEGGVAEGEDTITRGKGAYTNGIETEANGDASFAVGDNTIAQSYGEVAVGTYNALDATFNPTSATPTDKAFSVGVGAFQDRKDGFVVRKNGVVNAPEQTIAEFNADTSGKIVVTKEILNNELPNSNSKTDSISGAYNIDWNEFSNWNLTLTANATLTQTNIPLLGKEKTLTIYVIGDFALSLPTQWVIKNGGVYDGVNGSQIVVQGYDNGNFYTIIN